MRTEMSQMAVFLKEIGVIFLKKLASYTALKPQCATHYVLDFRSKNGNQRGL